MPLTHYKIVDEDAFFVTTQRLKTFFPSVAVASEQPAVATAQPADTPLARLRREDTLLLMVDVQERLMPAIHEAGRIEKNCALLARAARQLCRLIFTSDSILQSSTENLKTLYLVLFWEKGTIFWVRDTKIIQPSFRALMPSMACAKKIPHFFSREPSFIPSLNKVIHKGRAGGRCGSVKMWHPS